MFRMRDSQPSVGVRDVRDLDMPGVLGSASQPRRTFVFRQERDYGQMEGRGIRENACEYSS